MKMLSETTIVKSPLRFAIIAPGDPFPKVIMTSSDDINDLIGFYSMREIGLEGMLKRRYNSSSILFDIIGLRQTSLRPKIRSIDVWVGEVDRKSQMFSLILEDPYNTISARQLVEDNEKQIRSVVEQIAAAYMNKESDRLIYLGQIIIAILSAIENTSQYYVDRRKSIVRIFRSVLLFYIFAVAIVFVAISLRPIFERLREIFLI